MMKSKKFVMICAMMFCLIISTSVVFADNPNTDSEEGIDGTYTFTTDGEKYGYESYLVVEKDLSKYISARIYEVTLTEEGKLTAEVDSNQINHMTIEVSTQNGEKIGIDSANGVKWKLETEALPAGTYAVTFGFAWRPNGYLPYDEDMGGQRYFKHYITWNKAAVVKAQSITISATTASIEPIGHIRLTASVTPANAYYRKITWSS